MLDYSLASLKIPWLQASERLAPCSQLVAKTKKTPFYSPLTSGFAVHCVYSGLPISHGNRPNVPKPTRKNNFRRVQLPSPPPKQSQTNREVAWLCSYLCNLYGRRSLRFGLSARRGRIKKEATAQDCSCAVASLCFFIAITDFVIIYQNPARF